MEFPALVYKGVGNHQRKGGTYDFNGVADEAELDAALKDGWFATLPEAIDAKDAPPVSNAPATRAELEAKATELGIKFDGRTTDKKLGDLIAATLES